MYGGVIVNNEWRIRYNAEINVILEKTRTLKEERETKVEGGLAMFALISDP